MQWPFDSSYLNFISLFLYIDRKHRLDIQYTDATCHAFYLFARYILLFNIWELRARSFSSTSWQFEKVLFRASVVFTRMTAPGVPWANVDRICATTILEFISGARGRRIAKGAVHHIYLLRYCWVKGKKINKHRGEKSRTNLSFDLVNSYRGGYFRYRLVCCSTAALRISF